jgi:hypothetical protein
LLGPFSVSMVHPSRSSGEIKNERETHSACSNTLASCLFWKSLEFEAA